MAFTRLDDEKLNVIELLNDQPNKRGGMTAQQLKAAFDESAKVIAEYITNTLIEELESNGAISGASGAKNIGVSNREEFNDNTNIEDVLLYFRELIRQAVAGQIGDGDITEPKIANNAVTTTKVANSAITNSKLAGGITSDKIASVLASAIIGEIPTEKLVNIPYTSLLGGIRATQLYGDIPLSKLINGYVIPIENGGTGKTTQETIAMDVTFKDGTTGTYNLVVS